MSKIKCKVTRRNYVSGSDLQQESVRVSPASSTTITTRMLADDMQESMSLTRSDIVAALEGLSHFTKEALATGAVVKINGFGSFQLSFGLKDRVAADKKVKANMIEVKGIIFRPSDEFLEEIKKDVTFRVTDDCRNALSAAGTIEALRSYMEERRTEGKAEQITLKQLKTLCHCSYSTAYRRLRAFLTDGLLVRSTEYAGIFVPGPAWAE
jgi:Bacterial nucleoid DNA-binding protein